MNSRRTFHILLISLLVSASAAWSDIRLGSRNTWAAKGKRAAIPLYLIITKTVDVNQINFELAGLSSSISLDTVVLNEFLAETWTVNIQAKSSNTPKIQLQGTDDPVYSEWTTLCSLIVDPSKMNSSDTAKLSVRNVSVDNNIPDKVQGTDFKFWLSSKAHRADFQKDGILNQDDVTEFFRQLRTLPSDRPIPLDYEFNNFYPANLQDVALVYAYVIGLFPNLPEPVKISRPRPVDESNAEFNITKSKLPADNTYMYVIKGLKIFNFMSAEFFLTLDNGIVDNINISTVTSLAQTHGQKYGPNQYRVQYIAGLGAQSANEDVLRITVRHKAGKTGDAIKSVHVSQINGGAIVTKNKVEGCTDPEYFEFDPRANSDNKSCKRPKSSPVSTFKPFEHAPQTIVNGFAFPNGAAQPLLITVNDISGRVVYRQSITCGTWRLPNHLMNGLYIVQVQSGKKYWKFKLLKTATRR